MNHSALRKVQENAEKEKLAEKEEEEKKDWFVLMWRKREWRE